MTRVGERRLVGDGARHAIAPARRGWRERLDDELSARSALFGALAWVALLAIGIAVEPAPADPTAVPSGLESFVGNVLVLLLLGAAAGFGMRRRWGFAASGVASVVLLGTALACPITGHHEIAPWWFVQLGSAGALVGISAAGWRRRG